MAKIQIRPIEPLELEFKDGTIKKALFNNEAFIIFTEEFGNIDKELNDLNAKNNPFELYAKILYCGLKVVHPETTFSEAEQIIYAGGQELLLEISELLIANFNSISNPETLKKFKEMLTPEQKNAMKELGWL